MTKIDDFAEGLTGLFKACGAATPEEQMALLRAGIPVAVPSERKPWSNVVDGEGNPAVDITSVKKAELGVAMLMTFVEDGELHVVLCQSGAHYFRSQDYEEMPVKYTYPGGFGNLNEREGSSFVTPKAGAEEPEEAGPREVEEGIRDDQGNPVIMVDPIRCQPLDHDSVINKEGEPIILASEHYPLTPYEARKLKAHIYRLETSEDYREACVEHTKSPASNLPEVHNVKIFRILDAMTNVPFLYPGQEEHVRRLVRHENSMAELLTREGFGS